MNRLTICGFWFLTQLKAASNAVSRGGTALAILSCIAITPVSAQTHRLNRDETDLFQRLASTSSQQRKKMTLDPILCRVARQRGADMDRRNYFSHTNPSGQGPNLLVRREGFVLPSYYDRSNAGNNIESISMTTGSPKEVVAMWLKSGAHRSHVLGEISFYKAQRSIGVGVFRSPRAPHYKYYVFLSAPPNASLSPPVVMLKSPEGAVITSTGSFGN